MTSPVPAPARRRLVLAGFLAFVVIGAAQAMYGPAFAAFQDRFGVPLARVGWVVSLHFLGSFATIAASGLLIRRFGYRRLLTGGALLLGLGGAGVALAPQWGWVLFGALLIGLGFGIVDVGTNLLYVRSFSFAGGSGGAPILNLLHGMFGVGAVLGPLLVGAWLPSTAGPFLLVTAAAVLAAVLYAGLPTPPPLERVRGGLGAVWLPALGFTAVYFLYVAVEVGVASWEPTHLAPHVGESRAAVFAAVYWGSLTAGRFLIAPLSGRVRPGRLVLGAALLALLGVAAAHLLPLAPFAYALAGFALAPIFPTGLVWLQQVFPARAEQITPLVVAVANLGAVATARPIGEILERTSTAAVPTVLTVLAAAHLIAVGALLLRRRP